MPTIHFISGLGANEKAFSRIGKLSIPSQIIGWIENNENESLDEYAQRLIEKYNISSDDIVAGLSFGGLVAQKIAEINNNKNVILISSFRDTNDLKNLCRFGINYGLYKLTPTFRIPVLDYVVAKFLNSGSSESKSVLKEMLRSTDYKLMRWSLKKISEVKNDKKQPFTVYNLKGNKDRIVKTWNTENTAIIQNGSHFMVYDNADEITQIINKIIKTI